MATLIVNGYTIPVSAVTPPTRTLTEYGDFTQAIDGTDRGVIVARKWLWTVPTLPMMQSDAIAMMAAVLATPPVTASGDLLGGSFSVRGTDGGWALLAVAGGYRVVQTFMIRQI